jgi:hypothetical protein
MTLQASGPISLADIAAEFGGSTPHSLSEYRASTLVPRGVLNDGNVLIPKTGAVSLSDYYGAPYYPSFDHSSSTSPASFANQDNARVDNASSASATVSTNSEVDTLRLYESSAPLVPSTAGGLVCHYVVRARVDIASRDVRWIMDGSNLGSAGTTEYIDSTSNTTRYVSFSSGDFGVSNSTLRTNLRSTSGGSSSMYFMFQERGGYPVVVNVEYAGMYATWTTE